MAYNSLLIERRRGMHERTARRSSASERWRTITPNWPTTIFLAATRKALRYAQLAAAQAVGRGAYSEATSMLEPA